MNKPKGSNELTEQKLAKPTSRSSVQSKRPRGTLPHFAISIYLVVVVCSAHPRFLERSYNRCIIRAIKQFGTTHCPTRIFPHQCVLRIRHPSVPYSTTAQPTQSFPTPRSFGVHEQNCPHRPLHHSGAVSRTFLQPSTQNSAQTNKQTNEQTSKTSSSSVVVRRRRRCVVIMQPSTESKVETNGPPVEVTNNSATGWVGD